MAQNITIEEIEKFVTSQQFFEIEPNKKYILLVDGMTVEEAAYAKAIFCDEFPESEIVIVNGMVLPNITVNIVKSEGLFRKLANIFKVKKREG
jgi:hypothetical protein